MIAVTAMLLLTLVPTLHSAEVWAPRFRRHSGLRGGDPAAPKYLEERLSNAWQTVLYRYDAEKAPRGGAAAHRRRFSRRPAEFHQFPGRCRWKSSASS